MPRFSFITTCKGRWHHLVESLPALLRQPDSEVIVVDYDCPDRTADRVERDFPSARTVRAKDVTGFNPSHARNLGAEIATGETFVFVDADVVISDQFARYAESHVGEHEYGKPREPVEADDNSIQGTCVVHRRHFDLVGGYDEVLRNYGGEDLELYERLVTAQLGTVYLDPSVFLQVIPHSHEERTRFFEPGTEQRGFMIGKVYRVAKEMMIRIGGSFDIDYETRAGLYKEIARLVDNMAGMDRKRLELEVRFPDTANRGLHQTFEFIRAIKVEVTERDLRRGRPPIG